MPFFHLVFLLQKPGIFYKLMGSGRSGSFDKTPDLQQWAIFTVEPAISEENMLPLFIQKWLRFFDCERCSFILEAVDCRGKWDGKTLFENSAAIETKGMIAVLTRATIRLSRLRNFWKNVPAVSEKIKTAGGLICSFGVGEIPWVKQATFSVWQSENHMKSFAYHNKEHAEVIRKTRQEQWYSEEMFARFKIIACKGTIKGKNPLATNNVHL